MFHVLLHVFSKDNNKAEFWVCENLDPGLKQKRLFHQLLTYLFKLKWKIKIQTAEIELSVLRESLMLDLPVASSLWCPSVEKHQHSDILLTSSSCRWLYLHVLNNSLRLPKHWCHADMSSSVHWGCFSNNLKVLTLKCNINDILCIFKRLTFSLKLHCEGCSCVTLNLAVQLPCKSFEQAALTVSCKVKLPEGRTAGYRVFPVYSFVCGTNVAHSLKKPQFFVFYGRLKTPLHQDQYGNR